MKVSKLIADVEYITPKGTLKDNKSGWSMEEVGRRLSAKDIVPRGWDGPGFEGNEIHIDESFSESDHRGLLKQLNEGKGLKPEPIKLEVELLGS